MTIKLKLITPTKKIEEIKNEMTLLQKKREQLLERLYEDSISSSEEEFINLAIQHTKNLNSLNKLRFNLREKMKNSTLLNGLQFARYFKETLENILSK